MRTGPDGVVYDFTNGSGRPTETVIANGKIRGDVTARWGGETVFCSKGKLVIQWTSVRQDGAVDDAVVSHSLGDGGVVVVRSEYRSRSSGGVWEGESHECVCAPPGDDLPAAQSKECGVFGI